MLIDQKWWPLHLKKTKINVKKFGPHSVNNKEVRKNGTHFNAKCFKLVDFVQRKSVPI